jgi:hypothetical protein
MSKRTQGADMSQERSLGRDELEALRAQQLPSREVMSTISPDASCIFIAPEDPVFPMDPVHPDANVVPPEGPPTQEEL